MYGRSCDRRRAGRPDPSTVPRARESESGAPPRRGTRRWRSYWPSAGPSRTGCPGSRSSCSRSARSSVRFSVFSRLLDDEGSPFVWAQGQRQPPGSVDLACRLLLDEVPDLIASSRTLDGHGLTNGRTREVEGSDLDSPGLGEPVDHDYQTSCLHGRDIDLLALVDAVGGACPQHLLQLRGERARVLDLLTDCAVERPGPGQVGARSDGVRICTEQIVGAAVDPARVAVGKEALHGLGRQGQGTHEIPAGQGEHARLHRVEHRQEEMRALDVLSLRIREVVEIAKAQGRGGDGGGGAGDAVGCLEIVWRGWAEEPVVHLGADDLAQLAALHGPAPKGDRRIRVPGPEVQELEGELVVVVHRIAESSRIDPVRLLEAEHKAQEFGIAGNEGMVIGGARHEVVREICAPVGHGLNVLEGKVELLEGETAELAHQPGDELVSGDRERMPL